MEFEKMTKRRRTSSGRCSDLMSVRWGGGASLFDDWKDWAPDFLDQCSVPVRKIKKNQ